MLAGTPQCWQAHPERWQAHQPEFTALEMSKQPIPTGWAQALERNQAILKRRKDRPDQVISVAQRRAVTAALKGGLPH